VNKKNTGVQEFRSSGVQDSPEREVLIYFGDEQSAIASLATYTF
jgi:hypothetical protein